MFTLNLKLINDKIKESEISQTDLAIKLQISQNKLWRFLNDQSKNIDLELLSKISQELKLTINELIIEEENSSATPIRSETDILDELETTAEYLYKNIIMLKESKHKQTYFFKDKNSDLLLIGENQDIYNFEIKVQKNLKKEKYKLLEKFYINTKEPRNPFDELEKSIEDFNFTFNDTKNKEKQEQIELLFFECIQTSKRIARNSKIYDVSVERSKLRDLLFICSKRGCLADEVISKLYLEISNIS